jgi:hypothetical protein
MFSLAALECRMKECIHLQHICLNAIASYKRPNQEPIGKYIDTSPTEINYATTCSTVHGLYIRDCVALTIKGVMSIPYAVMQNSTLHILSIANCNAAEQGQNYCMIHNKPTPQYNA